MSLTIDSKAVLRAIADNPDAFPAVQSDLDDFARKMLAKQLKAKSTDVRLFKQMYRLAGETSIATILDGYAANDLIALVKKIDPHSPLARSGDDLARVRTHIVDLATNRAEPSMKAEKASRTKITKSAPKVELPKTGGVLESKVHSGKARTSRTKKAS